MKCRRKSSEQSTALVENTFQKGGGEAAVPHYGEGGQVSWCFRAIFMFLWCFSFLALLDVFVVFLAFL